MKKRADKAEAQLAAAQSKLDEQWAKASDRIADVEKERDEARATIARLSSVAGGDGALGWVELVEDRDWLRKERDAALLRVNELAPRVAVAEAECDSEPRTGETK